MYSAAATEVCSCGRAGGPRPSPRPTPAPSGAGPPPAPAADPHPPRDSAAPGSRSPVVPGPLLFIPCARARVGCRVAPARKARPSHPPSHSAPGAAAAHWPGRAVHRSQVIRPSHRSASRWPAGPTRPRICDWQWRPGPASPGLACGCGPGRADSAGCPGRTQRKRAASPARRRGPSQSRPGGASDRRSPDPAAGSARLARGSARGPGASRGRLGLGAGPVRVTRPQGPFDSDTRLRPRERKGD